MALLRRQPRHPAAAAETQSTPAFGTDAEDPVVRQYRFLLRTAPADALEAAHVEALSTLDRAQRAVLLRTTQDQLVAGLRLDPDDTVPLAHLLTLGERRVPGAVLRACEPTVLQQVARAVIDTEAVFGLFGGYAVWDGAEPEPPPVVDHMAGFDERWHQKLGAPPAHQGLAGPVTSDSWGLGP
jgi:hypothetical protein